ncbi:PBS lyase HEAT domain protein repeat-containing protein [Methanobacterium lacus]|uniref:PBS lyase HEAT domain protein repeat-containing protein n=1 Tax=Methanobacterium lacus (strain AL-21) TaxID=877455 RepID=F0T9H4_METLA|nr:HEAT repeat domain-containing protein [Methanobacterium lacus]ADZ08722.1 PBS lyase HEAT domain protein repeat-containing protein [Methanobacterium lacus]
MDSIEQEFNPDIELMEESKDVDGLIRALKNEDYLIRKDAAISLKRLGDERTVGALIESLKYESWQDEFTVLIAVRENSAEALGIIGDKIAVPALIETLLVDSDEEVRWKAAAALGRLKDDRGVDALITALNDVSWAVRRNATIALGDIGNEKGYEPLLNSLTDSDWHVRKYAAIALGKIGDERAIKPLVNTLKDTDSDVRWKSVMALGKIGKPAVGELLKSFDTDDWQLRSQIAVVLGKIKDERAVEPLIDSLYNSRYKNQNKYVRGRIIEALGNIGDERAVDALINALDDQYIYVRIKAEEALKKIQALGKGSWIVNFENGEISFEYPNKWEIIETTDDKKVIIGGVANNSIHFSINRNEEAEDISAEEFAEILKNVFMMQNSSITSEMGFISRGMETYILVGENPHGSSVTKIMIVAYKKKDMLYYLWFAGEPDNFEIFNDDVDLIVDSFKILT